MEQAHVQEHPEPPPLPSLLPGWSQHYSTAQGMAFFFCAETQESQWEFPSADGPNNQSSLTGPPMDGHGEQTEARIPREKASKVLKNEAKKTAKTLARETGKTSAAMARAAWRNR